MKKLAFRVINKLASKFNYSLVNTRLLIRDDKYLDKKEFRYILWLDRIYQKIQNVPGHIVELGVAKGRNSLIFGNLIELNGDREVRKYYGFDTFQGYTAEDIVASPHLNKSDWQDTSLEYVSNRISDAGYSNVCHLIKGDLKHTLPIFIKNGLPGFTPNNLRIALLYVDCNAYLPAIMGMEFLKEFMSPGGIICIDEKQQGGETQALIEFCKKNKLQFMKDASPFAIPSYTQIE